MNRRAMIKATLAGVAGLAVPSAVAQEKTLGTGWRMSFEVILNDTWRRRLDELQVAAPVQHDRNASIRWMAEN